jgi:cysteinyl-tRNA synthetase
MDNDFNIPGALILLSRYLEEVVVLKAQGKKTASKRLEEAIVYIGRLLGLFKSQTLLELTDAMLKFRQRALRTPEVITVKDIDRLVEDREEARESKEFAKADHVCNLLKLHGVVIIDGATKNKWKFTAN